MRITEEQARALVSGDYGRVSLEQVASYAVPFFIVERGTISARNPDAGQRLLANGTAFVVDLGRGPFVVTANHVVERAIEGTVAKCGLFPKQFAPPARPLVELADLRERIISRSAERDIATLRLTSGEVSALRVCVLTSAPMVPTEGTGGVAFVGYPAVQREIEPIARGADGRPELTISWAIFPGFGVAASVSQRQITFQFDRSELIDPPPGFRAPDPDLNLGGMSGGPMLMKCETQSGIEYWVPAGVITQGEMRADLNGGLLFASRLDGLQADGQLGNGGVIIPQRGGRW
ncbi:MAG: trypsin-like peptidase domain-containing protein [Proteobacteria bacterium]|nr:trypsin-like peptidase domain-containing protein [Pseudomonadota bacterium]